MTFDVANPIIEVHDLTVSYHRKPVLWDIDFTIPKGQLVGILGPNGSGKTTLLKSMMGLITYDSGYIKIFNDAVDNVRQRISYIPQTESVEWDFPASVMDVVLMGRYHSKNLFRRINSADKKLAQESLEKVGMQGYANRQIAQLSGGQQQRVFIARSLTQQADIYLMDEPFAGVDAGTESKIIDLLTEMRSEGKTILVVHHDIQSAFDYFDWFVFLNTRLVASGPKDDVFVSEVLQDTYGGKLTLLSKIGDLLREKELPVREKQ